MTGGATRTLPRDDMRLNVGPPLIRSRTTSHPMWDDFRSKAGRLPVKGRTTSGQRQDGWRLHPGSLSIGCGTTLCSMWDDFSGDQNLNSFLFMRKEDRFRPDCPRSRVSAGRRPPNHLLDTVWSGTSSPEDFRCSGTIREVFFASLVQ
jgi:hypothetical protein